MERGGDRHRHLERDTGTGGGEGEGEREKERERERGSGRGGRRRGRREVTERAGTAHRGAGKVPPAKDIAGQTEGCNRVGDREESRMCGEQELEPQGGKADMSARRGRALA